MIYAIDITSKDRPTPIHPTETRNSSGPIRVPSRIRSRDGLTPSGRVWIARTLGRGHMHTPPVRVCTHLTHRPSHIDRIFMKIREEWTMIRICWAISLTYLIHVRAVAGGARCDLHGSLMTSHDNPYGRCRLGYIDEEIDMPRWRADRKAIVVLFPVPFASRQFFSRSRNRDG